MNGDLRITNKEWPQDNLDSFSLYIHVPFCSKKCDYCHFFVLPDKDPFKHQLMEGLKLEWNRWIFQIKHLNLRSIYFGGGTPTLLGAYHIATILSWIEEAGFVLGELEITIEANPDEITYELMQAYADAGINRVSIGVQSLDDNLLTILSRQHSAKKAMDAVFLTEKAGIKNISIDLMYDIPQQRMDNWETTLDLVKELPVAHLSLYNLTIEPHTVFFKKRKILEPKLPDGDASLKMYEMSIEKLSRIGLDQYEISAFQKEGNYSKHNVGYWIGRPFLGMGPSAYSYWQGKRFRNVANLNKYCRQLSEGESPADFEEELSIEGKIRELLAINLRLREGVVPEDFQRRHGRWSDDLVDSLSKLEEQGFLEKKKGSLSLTHKGMLFYDTVASEIVL